MPVRKEVSQRKAELLQNLRAAYRDGVLAPGDLAPTVRDLAQEYNLSTGVVAKQIQVLVQEGLFYTVSGAGTFVGQAPSRDTRLFLFLLAHSHWDAQIKAGFEEEMASRGCATLVMLAHRAEMHLENGVLPPVAGVFSYGSWPTERLVELLNYGRKTPLPEVRHVQVDGDFGAADRILIDNVGGGIKATQHLLGAGHRRIAFLGIHTESDAAFPIWSRDRMSGWETALQGHGGTNPDLVFLPSIPATHEAEGAPVALQEAARRLLKKSEATAVVTANDLAAQQLIRVCSELELPASKWPAIVSFDDTVADDSQILTSLRLPWQEIGRTAATLLWERSQGQLRGPAVSRLLPMRIIPRLTCRANWSLVENSSFVG